MNRSGFPKDVTNHNTSSGYITAGASSKSPSRAMGTGSGGKGRTPGTASRSTHPTPSNTPGRTPTNKTARLTPSRNVNAPKTPGGGDRFIPNRQMSQMEMGSFLIANQADSQAAAAALSPRTLEYQRIMSENLNGGVTAPHSNESSQNSSVLDSSCNNYRILAYQKGKAPLAPAGHTNGNRVLYSSRAVPASSCKKSLRQITTQAEKVLDAPEIQDDYYLNILDWGSCDRVAVALGGLLYLWTPSTGAIEQLLELESTTEVLTSVNFSADGNSLAIGIDSGVIQLWDVPTSRRKRVITGHSERVGSLSWNRYVISSGDRAGVIYHHDVRVQQALVGRLEGHTQEVCGLRWSPDGRYLASGGNDNLIQIWAAVPNQAFSNSTPLHTFTEHQAAVKALAWCPWQPSILASGGGTADRHIRLWNANTGALVSATDTESQVSSLAWSEEYRELISAHGYPGNQLSIWKYGGNPMQKITDLLGHDGRILQLSMSPSGEEVMSAAADETLRVWRPFAVDPARKQKKLVERKKAEAAARPSGPLRTGLR